MGEAVLVLNANFEPINVCNIRRAIGLILTQKANLVLDGRGEIHTISNAYPIPSVIRLQKMVRRPRLKVVLTRREIFRRDNYTCQYCGRNTRTMTIDHVVPKHLGGEHSWTNMVTACSVCNHRKGGRTVREANMKLLSKPKSPPSSMNYYFGRHLSQNTEWENFITGW